MTRSRRDAPERPEVPTGTGNKPALTEAIRRRLEALPEILFACLHGSFQRAGPHRDVDVAVWVDAARQPVDGWFRYALDLSVTLQIELGIPVDIQVLNDAPLAFRYHALKGDPLFARDWELLHEVRARTWDDYFDFLPFARQYLREVLSA